MLLYYNEEKKAGGLFMQKMEFGKLVERLIYISGQKNYLLASNLDYDVSYISKWINCTMLPSAKNIKIISKKIAEFIVEESNSIALRELEKFLELSITNEENQKEVLTEAVETKLNEAYANSYNKNNKKVKQKTDACNSSLTINPNFRRRIIAKELTDLMTKGEFLEIIILCNLFSISRDEMINLTGNRNNPVEWPKDQLRKMSYLISFDERENDILLNTLALIHMLTDRKRIHIDLYSCDFEANTLIAVIKERYLHTALYNKGKCMTTVTSTDQKCVEEMYNTLEEIMNNEATRIFAKVNPTEMINRQHYMKFVMGQNIRILLAEVSELFMPTDLLLEIGEQVFGDSAVISKLKKIDTILQNATYNTGMEVLMYESCLRKYIANGEINFFNIPIKLTIEQRKRHIQHMNKLLKERENIHFRFIEKTLVEDLKNDEKSSIFLAKNISFLKEHYNEESNDYLIVEDKAFEKVLDKFYHEVWNNREDATMNKEESLEIIRELLLYLEILDENI